MSDISYYTEEGYKALKDEVHHLVSVERPKISAQIGEAIDKGDLSENASGQEKERLKCRVEEFAKVPSVVQ